MIEVKQLEDADSQHLRFDRTPGANGGSNGLASQYQFNADDDFVFQQREVLFAMTPGEINGADPHGSFADAFVVFNNTNFEVTSFNVEYELTEYDHGGKSSTVARKK